ncbi:hypothetical protein SAMN05216535_3144 [Stutzerimonas xanthomarina]|uniref:Uncharacterized protein n=2 Tax=Stutzerimonas xanthomarina TaxID=271420 RepID=A0A1M5RB99_9GAMM|nr:hypothetical protein SAMN05216535_3144 [Stutzerimonas xanthomarina]SHH23316.1 hypothetical protein SAMN02744645_2938 [Stutzerimonas xanthomarina DSM 18231]
MAAADVLRLPADPGVATPMKMPSFDPAPISDERYTRGSGYFVAAFTSLRPTEPQAKGQYSRPIRQITRLASRIML